MIKMPLFFYNMFIHVCILLLLLLFLFYLIRFVIKMAFEVFKIISDLTANQPQKKTKYIWIFFLVYLSSILCNCVLCVYMLIYMHKLTHVFIHTDNFHFLFDFLMISAIKSSALLDYRSDHSNFMKNGLKFLF